MAARRHLMSWYGVAFHRRESLMVSAAAMAMVENIC